LNVINPGDPMRVACRERMFRYREAVWLSHE
jgi:hypothetical protein